MFSDTSVELIELGLCVVVVVVVGTRELNRGGVVEMNDCWVVIGFTGFVLIKI